MDVKHWILFGAGLALTVSKYVASVLPAYAPYSNTIETVLAAAMAYFGATSPQLGGRKPPSSGTMTSTFGSQSPPKAPPPPPVVTRMRMLGMAMATAVLTATAGISLLALPACTPAQQAQLGQIESTVLADLTAGKTLQQIMADVGQIVAGQPGADVAVIVDDAIALLIDLGVIPPGILPAAKSARTELAPRVAAHRAVSQ